VQTDFPPTCPLIGESLISNTSNMARDAKGEGEGAAPDIGKSAAAAAGEVHHDLAALHDEVARLTRQIADVVAARGGATWRKAKSNVEGVLGDAQDKGQEAVDAVREVGDNLVDALDESLKQRPYTTLALALGIGFLFGATWRR
jgi:ElaB/YqjD/DUF883 family membrane-anchored ribosome-binding protein